MTQDLEQKVLKELEFDKKGNIIRISDGKKISAIPIDIPKLLVLNDSEQSQLRFNRYVPQITKSAPDGANSYIIGKEKYIWGSPGAYENYFFPIQYFIAEE